MKKTISILSLLLFSIASMAQGVQFFEGTWAEVKAEAKKQNKYIFMDAYTTWCGPCKMLKKKVFPEKIVGDVMNENFISVAIDMEKGEGIELAKKFEVRAYPTLLFFNADGQLVDRVVGAMNAQKFAEMAKASLNPENQLLTLKNRVYNTDNPSKEDLQSYINKTYQAYSPDTEMLKKWLAKLSDEDFKDEEVIALIISASYTSDIHSGLLTYLPKLKTEQKEIDKAIESLGFNTIRPAIRNNVSEAEFEKQIEAIEKALPTKAATTTINNARPSFYLRKKNYAKVNNAVDQLVGTLDDNNKISRALNSYAWKYYENDVEAKYMKKALSWINRSVMLDANYANVDTQAHIYQALGKTDKAIDAAQKAINLGKEAGQDVSETEDYLQKISKNN
ncbi:thioredoxin family protein [Flammeovirga pacifica]|nr:thioredoxin family protein [Flammeovirga pacifica]